MAHDFWWYMGAKFRDGCGVSPGPFESWVVPGHRASRLRNDGSVAANWQLFLPWPQARERTVAFTAVNHLAFPPAGPVPRVRAAVYKSRGSKCGYPGDLVADLGQATLSSPGARLLFGGATPVLPAGELYWFATWWETSVPAALITTTPFQEAGAYPVLGFNGPDDLTPRCGWARAAAFQAVGAGAWPDPVPLDAQTLTIGGQITSPPTTLGLPALYVCFT